MTDIRGKRSEILICEDSYLPSWYRYLYDPEELDNFIDNLDNCFGCFDYTYQGSEKYAPICQEIQNQLDKEEYDKWTEWIDFYKSNSYEYINEILGNKLTTWQKIVLKILTKVDKIKCKLGRRK